MKFFASALIANSSVLMVYAVGIQAECDKDECEKLPERLVCIDIGWCYEDFRNWCMYEYFKNCTRLDVHFRLARVKSCDVAKIEETDICRKRGMDGPRKLTVQNRT